MFLPRRSEQDSSSALLSQTGLVYNPAIALRDLKILFWFKIVLIDNLKSFSFDYRLYLFQAQRWKLATVMCPKASTKVQSEKAVPSIAGAMPCPKLIPSLAREVSSYKAMFLFSRLRLSPISGEMAWVLQFLRLHITVRVFKTFVVNLLNLWFQVLPRARIR